MFKKSYSLRGLMALVAIIALGIWAEQMRQRRAYCLRMAHKHRSMLLMVSVHLAHRPYSAQQEEKLRKTYPHAAWHLKVSDTYLYHARHPWLPLPPEPEEPFAFPPG